VVAVDGEFGQGCSSNPMNTDGWYKARNAVMLLRNALVAAGLARELPYLRAEVNAYGDGLVTLGQTSPEAAGRLAELLELGLAAEPPDPTDGRGQL